MASYEQETGRCVDDAEQTSQNEPGWQRRQVTGTAFSLADIAKWSMVAFY